MTVQTTSARHDVHPTVVIGFVLGVAALGLALLGFITATEWLAVWGGLAAVLLCALGLPQGFRHANRVLGVLGIVAGVLAVILAA